MRGELWTAEQDALMRQMAADGKSAAAVSEVLVQFSRSAVLGRAHRLGVKFTGFVVAAPRPPKPPRAAHQPRPVRVPGQRGRSRRWTDDQRAEARRLYLAGDTYWQIEAKSGVPIGSLPVLFRDLPRRRNVPGVGKRRPRELKLAAMAAIFSGKSGAKVAAHMGFCKHSLRRWQADAALVAEARKIAGRIIAERAAKAAVARIEREAVKAAEAAEQQRVNAPILAAMPIRHRQMMEMRPAGSSLQEVGDAFKVTRERVRQIEVTWRTRGLVFLGGRPVSAAAAERYGPKDVLSKMGRPRKVTGDAAAVFETAHRQLGAGSSRRPYNLSPAERERRAERMRDLHQRGRVEALA